MDKIRILVWNEYIHEKKDKAVQKVYGKEGIHGAIAKHLSKFPEFDVKTATLDDSEQGLSEKALKNTDVLLWWGHAGHDKVKDEYVDRIQKRVLDGMGMIFLHSAHFSKPFKRLLGTSCGLTWREAGEKELVWVVNPYHPITQGLEPVMEIEHEEMYGEVFDVPNPDDVIFISWFQGGEVFRSGMTWHRGRGKIFYFRPGHETFPTYFNEEVLKVIENACRWAPFQGNTAARGVNEGCHQPFHLMPIPKYEGETLEHHPDSSGKK